MDANDSRLSDLEAQVAKMERRHIEDQARVCLARTGEAIALLSLVCRFLRDASVSRESFLLGE